MRITESDIRRIIKNVVNENDGYVTGLAPSERTELKGVRVQSSYFSED